MMCTTRASSFYSRHQGNDEDVIQINELHDPILAAKIGEKDAHVLQEDVELIEGVYGALNESDYLSGQTAPVFSEAPSIISGLRECWIRLSASHRHQDEAYDRTGYQTGGRQIQRVHFKIHANLDPKHRDRIAF